MDWDLWADLYHFVLKQVLQKKKGNFHPTTARALSLWMIICKRPAPRMIICNHVKGMKYTFLRPFTMCFEYQRIKFQWKNGFSHLLTVRAEGTERVFFMTPLTNQIGKAYTFDIQRSLWLCFLEHLFSMLGSNARQWTTPPVFVSFQMS